MTRRRARNGPASLISCARCHGHPKRHLLKPVPGSIGNPAKPPVAARGRVCEPAAEALVQIDRREGGGNKISALAERVRHAWGASTPEPMDSPGP